MIIEVKSQAEIDALVTVISLGLCLALEQEKVTIQIADDYLLSPYTMGLLQKSNASAETIRLIHMGTELEDFESILPEKLPDWLNEMKSLALSILQSIMDPRI